MNKDNLLNFSLINIDKPAGPTSFTISDFVRKKLGLTKTSHMGTLDPKVTGVLPITLGRACKLASYFITHDKTYVGVLHTHKEQNIKELQEIIDKNFVGRIKQTPPHKSAVKRVERERTVYYFNLIEESEGKKDFLFKCSVEGGTYIRKICSDLGDMIGGAHMEELRRTAAGIFDEKSLIDLYEFEKLADEYKNGNEEPLKKVLFPAVEMLQKVLKTLKANERVLKPLLNGKPLNKDEVIGNLKEIKKNESFVLFCANQFVGVYKRTDEGHIFARPEFVYD